jgi:hypothetical protein
MPAITKASPSFVAGIVDPGRTVGRRLSIFYFARCKSGSPLALSIREGRRFVTAAQNRVVQIGRVGFSGVKGYDYSLTPGIYPDVAHSRDAHEWFSQFAHAFIAILAFRRDRDSLQHWFVCAVQVMRIGWIEMMRIEWFDHPSIYASGGAAPVLVLKDASCIA